VQAVVDLMKEAAFSHLMEIISEVAPEILDNEISTKIFQEVIVRTILSLTQDVTRALCDICIIASIHSTIYIRCSNLQRTYISKFINIHHTLPKK
jgi:hypothetical protein